MAAIETWNHPAWVDESTILGGAAKWIWETFKVTKPTNGETKVFIKKFNLDSIPSSADVEIAADNGFIFEINETEVANEFTVENNYGAVKSYNVLSNLIVGENTIRMTVKNFAYLTENPEVNPAGALYKLHIIDSSCSDIPDMCKNMNGYQTKTPEGYEVDDGGNCVLSCDPELNLIQNGDFENPSVPSGTFSIVKDLSLDSSSVLKWLVDWVNPSTGRLGLEIQNHIAGLPYSGQQHAELDGDHPVTIWQDIPTIPGKTYKLDFAYSGRQGRTAADNEITVKVDGGILGDILSAVGLSSGTNWTQESRTFVATGNTTKVEFTDTGTDTSFGGYLDNVTLRCQPEPEEPKGSIEITKYVCPTGTTVVRSANGVDGQVPEGCTLQSDATFGYVHGEQIDANSPYPELDITPTIGGTTNGSGILTINNLPATGRYLIVETNSGGVKLGHSDILGLYCEGDGDISDNNDNQELTFVPDDGIAHCVAYNKESEEEKLYVTTNPATLITSTSTTVNGTNGDMVATNEAFWWGSTPGGPFVPAPLDASSQYPSGWVGAFATSQDLSTGGVFSLPLSSLSPNTQYYFVAWSFVEGIWYPGNVLTFTTLPLDDNDMDDDGITDPQDNCPTTYNPTQTDADADGIGDICEVIPPVYACSDDIDNDGDGMTDEQDPGCDNETDNDETNSNSDPILGCMDQEANNYDPEATQDDDSCTYDRQSRRRSGSMSTLTEGRVLGASTSCGIYLNKYIKLGDKNNDKSEVIKLQQFLNEYLGLNLVVDGFYGLKTYNAVKAFQLKHQNEVLSPWVGVGKLKKENDPTGYVYKTTQRWINMIKCPELNLPMPELL